jgi:GntR family transcriptional repressor for pyruvate dehydrogenase complex
VAEFSPLTRQPSLAAQVTSQMLAAVFSGTSIVGEELPSERDLSLQFGVSRTVIREALRGLQAKGVLEVQTGKAARIVAVPASQVSEIVQLYVHGAQSQDLLGADDIAEVRTTLELRLSELAAVHATPGDLDLIEASLAAMHASSDAENAARHDTEFHLLLAAATHNPLYVTLLESINAVMAPYRLSSLRRPGRIEVAVRQHQEVLDAVRTGDQTVARQAMQSHLDDSRQFYRKTPDGADVPPDGRSSSR